MTDLTVQDLKRVRQYLSPNTRAEVDAHLLTGMPLNEPLRELLRQLLVHHIAREIVQKGRHVQDSGSTG